MAAPLPPPSPRPSDEVAPPRETLRARRASAEARAFERRFFERSPLFWPIVPAAERMGLPEGGAWPEVATYGRAFEDQGPVRFVAMEPPPRRKRRRMGPVDARALYDGRITLEGTVPTRPRSWHDLLNALVWGTFPRAKRALHERQHRALAAHVPAGATRIPGARTRELDALALIDEGGVVVLAKAPLASTEEIVGALDEGSARGVVFGHALYEGLVLGTPAMAARAVVVPIEDDAPPVALAAPITPTAPSARVGLVDTRLAEVLARPDLVPEMLPRLPLAALAPLTALSPPVAHDAKNEEGAGA